MSRLFAAIGIAIILAGLAQFWPATANADDAANVATYRKFIDSLNKGDAAGALALFTDTASLSGVRPNCVPNPCVGRAAIQNQLQTEVSGIHIQLQLLGSVNVVNGNVVAEVAHRNDPIRAVGLSRVVVVETVTFTGDRISKFVVDPQASDPQTAAFLRALSAPAAAPAAPAQVVAPVTPPAVVAISAPNTGDGGLLTNRHQIAPWLPVVVLVAAIIATSATLRRTRTN